MGLHYPVKKVYITQGWGENPEMYARFGLKGLSFSQVLVVFGLNNANGNSFAKLAGWYAKHFNRHSIFQANAKKLIHFRTIAVKYPCATLGTWVNCLASLAFSFINICHLNIKAFIIIKHIKGSTKALPHSASQVGNKLFPQITFSSFSLKPLRSVGWFVETCRAGSVSVNPRMFVAGIRTVFNSTASLLNRLNPSLWYWFGAEIA